MAVTAGWDRGVVCSTGLAPISPPMLDTLELKLLSPPCASVGGILKDPPLEFDSCTAVSAKRTRPFDRELDELLASVL